MEPDLITRLRDRIVTAMHVGRVHAGDRLPSIREVARETGANARAVAKAYRVLEREGLVEIRGRSGVYVAPQEHWGGQLLAETARWLAGVLIEGWKRHIPIPDPAELVRKCTGSVRLHAAFIDDNVDRQVALCEELQRDFGLECTPVSPALLPDDEPLMSPTRARLPRALRQADLIVSTSFHAGEARRAAHGLDKPLVVITLHPDLAAAIERRVQESQLTVVCVDPAFGEQIRAAHAGASPDRIRVVRADDAEAVAALDAREPVLLTRAARQGLGDVGLTLLVPHSPTISAESAREIAELVIRLNMEASRVEPRRHR